MSYYTGPYRQYLYVFWENWARTQDAQKTRKERALG